MTRRGFAGYLTSTISAAALASTGLFARAIDDEPPADAFVRAAGSRAYPLGRIVEIWAIAFADRDRTIVEINRLVTQRFGPFPIEFEGDYPGMGRVRTVVRAFKDYVDSRRPDGTSNFLRCADGDIFVWKAGAWEKLPPTRYCPD